MATSSQSSRAGRQWRGVPPIDGNNIIERPIVPHHEMIFLVLVSYRVHLILVLLKNEAALNVGFALVEVGELSVLKTVTVHLSINVFGKKRANCVATEARILQGWPQLTERLNMFPFSDLGNFV
jgi:hypothetical protein